MFLCDSLCEFGDFFRRGNFRALWDGSGIPDPNGHSCPWVVLCCMFLEVILNRLLEFSEIGCALRRDNLEVKCCLLPRV